MNKVTNEGDYLFFQFCKDSNYPPSREALSELMVTLDEKALDDAWEMILLQYEANTAEKCLFVVKVNKRKLEIELARHNISFSWDGDLLYASIEHRLMIHNIITGQLNRGVITPSSFGGHLKGR